MSLIKSFCRLPSKYRIPVILCYLEGQTHEEAARQLQSGRDRHGQGAAGAGHATSCRSRLLRQGPDAKRRRPDARTPARESSAALKPRSPRSQQSSHP